MTNETSEKLHSQRFAHKKILQYVGIFTLMTIVLFAVGGRFLNNYMKNIGANPIITKFQLSAQEMIKVQKRGDATPGEVGYEFKFDRPLAIVHNYLPGADRGYGTEIPLINDIPRKLTEPDLKNIETSEKRNFKDGSPAVEDLAPDKVFIVVNRIDVEGIASVRLYILRDLEGQEYLISGQMVPWNR